MYIRIERESTATYNYRAVVLYLDSTTQTNNVPHTFSSIGCFNYVHDILGFCLFSILDWKIHLLVSSDTW